MIGVAEEVTAAVVAKVVTEEAGREAGRLEGGGGEPDAFDVTADALEGALAGGELGGAGGTAGGAPNQDFMEARPCCCTVRTVLSTWPFFVLRSEQWKPSDRPMGCAAVLFMPLLEAETVASRQGSPGNQTVRN